MNIKEKDDRNIITSKYLKNIKDRKKKRNLFVSISTVLAMIVAVFTVTEMIQPAAAKVHTEIVLDCHYDVHEHTEECYEILYDEEGNETGKKLICGEADFVAHQHTDECYRTVFNEDSQSEERVLVCELPGIEPHVHDDSCFEERQVLVCEEDHEHDETCYETENVLVCEKVELHEHDESCYDEEGNLICDKPAVHVHQHDDNCFKTITVDDGSETEADETEGSTETAADGESETGAEDAAKTLVAETGSYTIAVTYGADAEIPDNALLDVVEITKGFTQYEDYYAQVEEMLDSITEIQSIRIFDISIMAGDDPENLIPVEPNAPVDVKITFARGMKMDEDDKIQIVHFTDPEPEVLASETVEKQDTVTDVIFTTESFSTFAAVQERITSNMSNGAIAYLSFDNDISGYSGAGARANKINANKPKVVGEGHSGGAVYLDGNTYLTLTKENGTPLLTGLDEFTVSYWVKTTESTSDGTHDNWAYYAAPNNNPPVWQNERYIAIGHSGSNVTSERFNNNGSRPQSASAGNVTPVNEWHHVAVVYTNNNTQLYVDGVMVDQEGSNVDLSNMLGNNSIFQIGRANWGNGEGFRGYLDEFSVFNYPLNADEINLLKNSTNGAVALNPMNENGVLPGTLPNNRNVTSTHYKDMTIDGHVVNPSNSVPSGQRNDLQYSRIYVPVTYGSDGKATITLPSNDQLGNFTVSEDDTAHSIIQSQDHYQWELKGWMNIATDEYFDTRNGPVEVTVDSADLNVFYADWEPANYDYTINNPIETVSTSDFITIKMFDYNEIHNIDERISLPYQVDGDAGRYIPRSTIESEEWYIHQTSQGQGDFLQFVDNTDGSNCWQYGTIGNTQGRNGGNRWNNYSGTVPVEGIAGPWGQVPTTHVIGEMFDESNTPGTGINYLGQSDYLFSYDPTRKMYSYDSDTNGAVYNQTDQRFYVADRPKTIDCFNWNNRNGFVPYNDYYEHLSYNDGTVNYWFGMSVDLQFWLPDTPGTPNANQMVGEDMIFNFRGDDDVWVLIDGKLALDIGGIHEELDGLINFSTGEITVRHGNSQPSTRYNLRDMGIGAGNHTLSFYYMERGGNASNCEIRFNLVPRWIQPPANVKTAKVTKTWSPDTPSAERNSIVFSLLSDEQPVAGSSVTYDDGTYDEVTGEWFYVWEYLEGGHTYEVVEQADSDFDVTKTSELGDYEYWAISGYNDEDAYDGNPILLGNGNNDQGYLLTGTGGVAEGDIIHDVIHHEDVTDDVKWTVEGFDRQNLHFYLKNKNGQYLSIINGNIALVSRQQDASWFYVGPTGDLNDANSNHRLMIDSNHVITVGEKKDAASAGEESTDRIRIYAWQSFENNIVNYTITNTYIRFPIQFKKVSIEEVSIESDGLEGAVFSLYDQAPVDGEFDPDHRLTTLTSKDGGYLYADSSSAVDADIVFVENGKLLNVHPGTYYLKEDTYPTGYYGYADYFTFTVDEDGVLSFAYPDTMAGDPKYIVSVPEVIDEEEVDVQTGLLPNTRGSELPYTGGPGTTLFYLFGLSLAGMAGVLFALRRH